jgi:hypothetical protein
LGDEASVKFRGRARGQDARVEAMKRAFMMSGEARA